MLKSPFLFEAELKPSEYQKLGKLSLRWSHTEHIIGNCLKVMLRLTDEEAIPVVFTLPLESRLQKLSDLSEISPVNAEAKIALVELVLMMKLIQYVRNTAIHAILVGDGTGTFHLRSRQRNLQKADIFATEELTNYVAHVVLSLRFALGIKGYPDERHPLPDRPAIPKFLLEKFPDLRNKPAPRVRP